MVHIDFNSFVKNYPDVVKGLTAVDEGLHKAGVDPLLAELIFLRASQINGCGFCLQYHLNSARKKGLDQKKIDLLPTWFETPSSLSVFTEQEYAVLALTDDLTRIANQPLPHTHWDVLRKHFSESQVAGICVAVSLINSWNRIAISLQFTPIMP